MARQFQQSQRRRTGWEEGPGTMTESQVTTTNTSVILGNGQINVDNDGLTVVRLRGMFELVLEAATNPGDGFDGAIGIGIVSAPAFTIGVTAVPTPLTEIEWEGWMYHQFFSLHSPAAVQASVSAALFVREMIDSKAMRKFSSDEVIYAAAEFIEHGTASISVRLGTRLLLKLP